MRVALLMNFIAPYRVPFYESLQRQLGDLRAFLSTAMESDRSWVPEWGTLDVTIHRTVTLRRIYRDPFGFRRQLLIHIPYDTLPLLLRFQPHVIISAELGARTMQAVIFKLLRPRTQLVVWCTLSEHSERAWSRMRERVRSWMLRRADAILVNGESGARYLARLGVGDVPVVRINQPVDTARFMAEKRIRPATELSRLVCVGTLTGRKGVLPFSLGLAAWAAAHPERVLEIWWLGDGDQRQELEALPTPSNLKQRFLGDVPYSEVPAVYAQCDMLVFPTLLDEWGLVVNEAMAAGLPVLGSVYSQAVEELVTEGVSGWIYDPMRDASLTDVLERAMQCPAAEIAAMREAARHRISFLTPDTAAERVAETLRQLAAGRRVGSASTAVAPGSAQ